MASSLRLIQIESQILEWWMLVVFQIRDRVGDWVSGMELMGRLDFCFFMAYYHLMGKIVFLRKAT